MFGRFRGGFFEPLLIVLLQFRKRGDGHRFAAGGTVDLLAGQFFGDGEVLITTRAVDFVFSDKPIPVRRLNLALFYKMSIRIF